MKEDLTLAYGITATHIFASISPVCVCPLFYILSLSSKKMKTRSLFQVDDHETLTPTVRISPDCLQVTVVYPLSLQILVQILCSSSPGPKHMFSGSIRKPVIIILPTDNA